MPKFRAFFISRFGRRSIFSNFFRPLPFMFNNAYVILHSIRVVIYQIDQKKILESVR